MRLESLGSPTRSPPPSIITLLNFFHVRRVHAGLVEAEMVDYKARGKRPDLQLPGDLVSLADATCVTDLAVAFAI